jgi:hypothetical protein
MEIIRIIGEEVNALMSLLIGVSILLTLGVVGVLAYLVRRVAFAGDLPVTSEWIEDLSLDRYRPMLHMLNGDDIEFLRSQPGFTPRMATKLRAQRTQIFRGYLKSLETDFIRVCSAIKLIMLQSQTDRPELAMALIRQQIAFACSMFGLRIRLQLYSWGICGVDVTQLVKLFDCMRLELHSLVPASSKTVA